MEWRLRTRTIGGMLALTLALAGEAWGAEASGEETLEVPPVMVGATRLPDVGIDLGRVPNNVTVITAEQIRQKGARTVQEALQDVPSLIFYDNTGNNFQQTVDLRGFNGDPEGTTVLVDGVRVNEPGINQVNWELIPLDQIERIEVTPGPGGSIYGRNALGGVINIVTKRGGARAEADGEVAGGSYGRFRSTASAAGQLPYGFDLRGGYTRDQEDGWRDDSEARINRAFGKLGWRYGDATDMALTYMYSQSRIHQAGSLTTFELNTNPRQAAICCSINPEAQNFWILNVRQRLPWGFSLALNGSERMLDSSSFITGRTSTADDRGRTQEKGGTAQLSHESAPFGWRNVLSFGADYQRAETGSLLFGSFPAFAANSVSDQTLGQDSVGFFGQDVLDITRYTTVTAGLRYDRFLNHLTDLGQSFDSPFGTTFTPNQSGFARYERLLPRAGVTARPSEWGTLYFNFADGFRAPFANEILAAGGTFLGGGTHLSPVLTRSLETGARVVAGPWAEASLALYHSETRNEIFPVVVGPPVFGSVPTQDRNVPKINRDGLEFTARAWWKPWLDGTVTYSYARARFGAEFLEASPDGSTAIPVQKGDRVPLVPEHRLSLGVNVHPVSWLTLSASELWVSDTVPDSDPYNIAGRQAGYWVTNASIRAQYKGLTAFVDFNNVFDQKYETWSILANFQGANQVFRVPAMPFNVFGGVSYRYELPSWVTGGLSQGDARQGSDR